MMQLFSTKYNTYLGQPKSIHYWVFFWSHYICGYWKVYYSVYHSQPLESCCQSKRKPWEMFSHQQETTYNICKSSKFIFSRGFCSDNIILFTLSRFLLLLLFLFFMNSLLLKKRLGEKDVWRTDCDLDSLFLLGNVSSSIFTVGVFKTESTRKLSNINSQWTKTLYQNNLKNIAFFFTFFKG